MEHPAGDRVSRHIGENPCDCAGNHDLDGEHHALLCRLTSALSDAQMTARCESFGETSSLTGHFNVSGFESDTFLRARDEREGDRVR